MGRDDGLISGFQLAYDKPGAEKLVSWTATGAVRHERVDDGARPGQHPGSPLLVTDGALAADRVRAAFLARAGDIDSEVAEFVSARLGDLHTPHMAHPARSEPLHPRRTATAPRFSALRLAGIVLLAAILAPGWQACGGAP